MVVHVVDKQGLDTSFLISRSTEPLYHQTAECCGNQPASSRRRAKSTSLSTLTTLRYLHHCTQSVDSAVDMITLQALLYVSCGVSFEVYNMLQHMTAFQTPKPSVLLHFYKFIYYSSQFFVVTDYVACQQEISKSFSWISIKFCILLNIAHYQLQLHEPDTPGRLPLGSKYKKFSIAVKMYFHFTHFQQLK